MQCVCQKSKTDHTQCPFKAKKGSTFCGVHRTGTCQLFVPQIVGKPIMVEEPKLHVSPKIIEEKGETDLVISHMNKRISLNKLHLDVILSGLQKSIRRCALNEAWSYGIEGDLFSLLGMHGPAKGNRTNLVNRLRIILVEDLFNWRSILAVEPWFDQWERERTSHSSRKYLLSIIKELSESKKIRLISDFKVFLLREEYRGRLGSKYDHIFNGWNDYGNSVTTVEKFVYLLNNKNPNCLYWYQQDPSKITWSLLLEIAKSINKTLFRVISTLQKIQSGLTKNHREGYLYVMQAILFILFADKLELAEKVEHIPYMTDDEAEQLYHHHMKHWRPDNLPFKSSGWLPEDVVVDKHTTKGRSLGKTAIDFAMEGSRVCNEDKRFLFPILREIYMHNNIAKVDQTKVIKGTIPLDEEGPVKIWANELGSSVSPSEKHHPKVDVETGVEMKTVPKIEVEMKAREPSKKYVSKVGVKITPKIEVEMKKVEPVLLPKKHTPKVPPKIEVELKPRDKGDGFIPPHVVNVKVECLRKRGINSFLEWINRPDSLYIGRNMDFYVKGATKSKWHNPFKLGKNPSHEDIVKVLHDYEQYIKNTPELYNSLHELSGKELGCWCVGEHECHGDVLVKLFIEKMKERSQPKISVEEPIQRRIMSDKVSFLNADEQGPIYGQKVTASWKPVTYITREWVYKGPFTGKRSSIPDKTEKRAKLFHSLGDEAALTQEKVTDSDGNIYLRSPNIGTKWPPKTTVDTVKKYTNDPKLNIIGRIADRKSMGVLQGLELIDLGIMDWGRVLYHLIMRFILNAGDTFYGNYINNYGIDFEEDRTEKDTISSNMIELLFKQKPAKKYTVITENALKEHASELKQKLEQYVIPKVSGIELKRTQLVISLLEGI